MTEQINLETNPVEVAELIDYCERQGKVKDTNKSILSKLPKDRKYSQQDLTKLRKLRSAPKEIRDYIKKNNITWSRLDSRAKDKEYLRLEKSEFLGIDELKKFLIIIDSDKQCQPSTGNSPCQILHLPNNITHQNGANKVKSKKNYTPHNIDLSTSVSKKQDRCVVSNIIEDSGVYSEPCQAKLHTSNEVATDAARLEEKGVYFPKHGVKFSDDGGNLGEKKISEITKKPIAIYTAVSDLLTPTGIMYCLTSLIFLYFSLAAAYPQGIDSVLTQILIDLSFIYSWSVFCDKGALIMRAIFSATLLYSISFVPIKKIHDSFLTTKVDNKNTDGITQEAKDQMIATYQLLLQSKVRKLANVDGLKNELNNQINSLESSYKKQILAKKNKGYPYPETLPVFKAKKASIHNLKIKVANIEKTLEEDILLAKQELESKKAEKVRGATEEEIVAANVQYYKVLWAEGTNIFRRLIIFLALIWFSTRWHQRYVGQA